MSDWKNWKDASQIEIDNMTIDDVIEIFNRHIYFGKQGGQYAARPHMVKALEIAVSALKKQQPLKPKFEHMPPHDNYCDGKCLYCGDRFYFHKSELNSQFAYCKDCGQKFDWSDYKEENRK